MLSGVATAAAAAAFSAALRRISSTGDNFAAAGDEDEWAPAASRDSPVAADIPGLPDVFSAAFEGKASCVGVAVGFKTRSLTYIRPNNSGKSPSKPIARLSPFAYFAIAQKKSRTSGGETFCNNISLRAFFSFRAPGPDISVS